MKPVPRTSLVLVVFIISLSLAVVGTFSGCNGSDADKAARETVEEITGKNLVEKGEKIKQQINELSEKEIENVQQDILKGTYGQEQQDKNE